MWFPLRHPDSSNKLEEICIDAQQAIVVAYRDHYQNLIEQIEVPALPTITEPSLQLKITQSNEFIQQQSTALGKRRKKKISYLHQHKKQTHSSYSLKQWTTEKGSSCSILRTNHVSLMFNHHFFNDEKTEGIMVTHTSSSTTTTSTTVYLCSSNGHKHSAQTSGISTALTKSHVSTSKSYSSSDSSQPAFLKHCPHPDDHSDSHRNTCKNQPPSSIYSIDPFSSPSRRRHRHIIPHFWHRHITLTSRES